jgi:hypothetical protein
MSRPLTVTSNEGAIAAGWNVVIKDEEENPAGWELVQKASYEDDDERVLHTTKRRKVPGGWIYENYTEIVLKAKFSDMLVPIASRALTSAKAMCFVPEGQ